MESAKKTSLPTEPPATAGKPVEKPEEEKDRRRERDRSKRDRDKEGRPPGQSGPSNAEFFKLPPPSAPLCPNPKLEICLKCIRCYGPSFLLIFRIYGGLLIIEGLGRIIFDILHATASAADESFMEDHNLILYYPKNLISEAMVNFYVLEKDEAIVEPFWTSLGASLELKQVQKDGNTFMMSTTKATSQRYLFFIGAPEKFLLDVIPGLLFLLVSLSIVKGAKVKLVCKISTALLILGALILLIQICATIYFVLGSIFQQPLYKALRQACKNVTNTTDVHITSGNSTETTTINPLGCKYLQIMEFPLLGCIPLLILFILKIHCTKAACALMRNTAFKSGAVAPAPSGTIMPTASTSTSKKPEAEPSEQPEEAHNNDVIESAAGAEVKEEPPKSEDEDEADGKKKKKDKDKKEKKRSKGSRKKGSKGSNKKSKKGKKKSS